MYKTDTFQTPALAIIGVSGYAKLILDSLLATLPENGARLVAATIINPSAEKETCALLESRGCRIFQDYTVMLQELSGQLDLCLIPTGIPWHVEMCCRALEAGVNVLVEKPLAPDLDGALEVIRVADKAQRFVGVGFQSMYRQAHYEMKAWLHSGAIGRILSIRAEGSWPRDRAYYSRNSWTGRLNQGGKLVLDSPLNNAFSHVANLSLFFAEPQLDKCAVVRLKRGKLSRHFPIETYDTVMARLETESGCPITWAFTHADDEKINPHIMIEAEAGRFEWKFDEPSTGCDAVGNVLRKWPTLDEESMRRDMMRHTIDCLTSGKQPFCSARFVLPHARIVSEIFKNLSIRDFTSGQSDPWRMRRGIFDSLKENHLRELTTLKG